MATSNNLWPEYQRFHQVDTDRWRAAQTFQRDNWLRASRGYYAWKVLSLLGLRDRYRGDDWNHWWAKHFDNYARLPEHCDTLIEFGCGPYTNARLVLLREIGRAHV